MADTDLRIDIEPDTGAAPAKGPKEGGRSIEEINAETRRYQQEAANYRAMAAQQRVANLSAAIDVAQTESESAKQAYVQAMDMGDFAAAAAAQEAIAAATVKVQNLEAAERYYQNAPQQPSDPVEAFAQGRTEASAAWIRQHPDFVRDQRKFVKLQAAHHDALANDLTPDTSAYFEHVERRIGLRKPAPAYDPNDPRTHVRGSEVRLTPGESERATDGSITWGRHDLAAGRCKANQVGEPIGHAEFARRKRRMMADGYYDRVSD
jgi:hypothetical protein